MFVSGVAIVVSACASNLTAFLGAWAKIEAGAGCNTTDPWATGGGGYFPNPTTLSLPSNASNAPPGKFLSLRAKPEENG